MTETFLLEWLSKAESSAFGECEGAILDALLVKGLARVEWVPNKPAQYGRVYLTDAGRAALQKRERET